MKLSTWLADKKISQAVFAEMIGSSQPQVARFAAGARVPNRPTMLRIAEVTCGAVGPADFYDVPESGEDETASDPTSAEPSEAAD